MMETTDCAHPLHFQEKQVGTINDVEPPVKPIEHAVTLLLNGVPIMVLWLCQQHVRFDLKFGIWSIQRVDALGFSIMSILSISLSTIMGCSLLRA